MTTLSELSANKENENKTKTIDIMNFIKCSLFTVFEIVFLYYLKAKMKTQIPA